MAAPHASPAPDRRFLISVATAGVLAFGLACWLLDALARAGVLGPLTDSLFITPYWEDAVAVVHGAAPYRDFALEYPPLSLPAFVLPALLGGLDYERFSAAFELLMAACGMAIVPIVIATVARLGGTRGVVIATAVFVAVSPLLTGSMIISRYDLWPALLTSAAIVAALWDRHRAGFALLALAVLAKVYPVVLAPLFVAFAWQRAGRREALVALAIGILVGVAGLLPFVALAPEGALDPFARAIARPLQVESLGAAILFALHDLARLPLDRATWAFESYNLEGPVPSAVAAIQSAVLAAALGATWLAGALGRLTPARLALLSAAAIAASVALGKVLSPQYVIWLIPPIAILAPVKGLRPLAGLAAVLLLTSLYYPGWYEAYVTDLDPAAVLAVLVRNVALVLLAVNLLFSAVRVPQLHGPLEPGSRPSPA